MAAMPELLPIRPFTHPAQGEVVLPGSKSLTNRALLLAALCDQPVTLTGALSSEDTHLMANALQALGFDVARAAYGTELMVRGQADAFPDRAAELFVGLAGTAARFLTALAAAAPRGRYRIDGVPQMRKRPMQGLITALRTLGASIRCLGEEGFFPLEIEAKGLAGGTVEIDASASSQLLSALLMVAPLARGPVQVRLVSGVRWTFVEMTRRLMAEFGVQLEASSASSATFTLHPSRYRSPGRYAIEPDATAASYWQALPLVVGGQLMLPGLRPPGAGLQGDSAFIEVLQRVQARHPGKLLVEDFHEISDTFLTLAAISPLLAGPTRLTGLAHTRLQETDRVAGMATELRRLGQEVVEEHDALTITPRPLRAGQIIETYGDHRFAMSFGILGCHDLLGTGEPWLTIRNPACCAKTFPHFFELLDQVREKSSAS
jgi:3-phosphoshikimate 1-carboxyvinyltransferase